MATITGFRRKLSTLDVQAEAVNIIIETSQELIQANRDWLFNTGRDKNGNILPPYKSARYAQEKLELNPAGVTDLKLTGDTYSAMYLNVSPTTFTIGSNDEKAPSLEARYGNDIWGVSEESLGEYTKTSFGPKLRQAITAKTGLAFG